MKRSIPLLFLFFLVAAPPARSQVDARTMLAVGDSLFGVRAYPAAAEAFEAALQAITSGEGGGDDAGLEARALYGLGATYNYLGRSAEADSLLTRALPRARAVGDRPLETRILHSLGTSHFQRASHERAIEFYRQGLELAHEIGDTLREGLLWNAIGNLENRRGHYAEAIHAIERALPLVPRSLQPRVYTNVATSYLRLARYEEALDAFGQGLTLADSVGDVHARGIALNGLGNVYSSIGENDRARESYEQSLAITRQTGVKQAEAATLLNLATLEKKAGRLDAALARLDEVMAVQHSMDDLTGDGLILLEMAEVRILRGEAELALAAAREAVAIEVSAGQRRQEVEARLVLTAALLAAGDAEASVAAADTARSLALQVGNPDLVARVETRQARALMAAGRGDESLALLRTATDRTEKIRATLETDPGKIGFLEERQEPFHLLVELLVARGEPLEALAVAERARARAFADLLAGRVDVARAEDAERLARVRAAEAAEREGAALEAAAGTAREAAAGAEGGGLLALRGPLELEAIEELAREDPELASLVSAQAIPPAGIVGLARDEDATLLAYLVADSAVTIWVVAPSGEVTAHREPWPRGEVRAAVEAVREAWARTIETRRLGPETMAASELAELHARLVAPVAARLPADPEALVYVIPHDALWLLPFAALRDAAGRALVERHTIATAPSASVLSWLRTREAEGARGSGWLGVADPALPADSGLEPLPGAEREVAELAERFDPGARVVLTGAEATEAAFRELAPGRATIHLAAHGVVSDLDPLASAVALAPGDGHDGWLRTPEVFGLDLSADLVVLSGCSTGLGKLSGDGILGLSRAFLFAGAPAVVVSLWDVSDRATADLMEDFYEAREVEGLSGARSLRHAQLALRERHPHPFLWASFTVIGRAE
jgi:CHAT domain-containing protein/Tfp pilus assembly protein PilF